MAELKLKDRIEYLKAAASAMSGDPFLSGYEQKIEEVYKILCSLHEKLPEDPPGKPGLG